MSLTKDDLAKIAKLNAAQLEQFKDYVDQRISQSEVRTELKINEAVSGSEDRILKKLDSAVNMIQGDLFEIGRDIKDLKRLKPKVKKLERQISVPA